MRLTELTISTLPGIEPGFTVSGIQPGLNIVSGPNAIGKSSLLRAVGLLVCEPRAGDPPVSLSATLVDREGHAWHVSRTGGQVAWEQDGVGTAAPRFPGADQLRTYMVSLESLLVVQDNDRAFASQVMRILRGGYDLHALRNHPDLSRGPQHGRAEAKRLLQASKGQRDVLNDYHELLRQQDELPLLQEELQRARDDASRAKAFEDALQLVKLDVDLLQLDEELAQFPEGMGDLLGREEQELADLRLGLEKLNAKVMQSRAQADRQAKVLSECGLIAPWPSVDRITTQQAFVHQGEIEEAKRKQCYEDLRKARNRLETAKEALGGVAARAVPNLSPETVSQAEGLARKVQSSVRRVDDLQSRLSMVAPSTVAESDLDRLRRGIDALRAWQSTAAGSTVPSRLPIFIALVFALGVLVASTVAKVWIAAGLAVAVLAALLWAVLSFSRPPVASGRAAYDREGLEPPSAWTSDGVRARLSALEDQLVTLQRKREDEIQVREWTRQLDMERVALKELERQQERLAATVGFSPDYSVLALDRFVSLVKDYQEAEVNIRDLDSTIAALDMEIDNAVAGAQELLEQAHCSVSSDSLASVNSALEELLRRVQTAEAATKERDSANQRLELLQKEVEADDAKMADFWKRVGLAASDEPELKRRLALRDSWLQCQEKRHDTQVERTLIANALKEHEEVLALALAGSREQLKAGLERAHAAEGKKEELTEQVISIQQSLKSAGTDLRLEVAKAGVEQARQDLVDARDEVLTSSAARFLLDDVEESYTAHHEPEILRAAKSKFAAFTQHAFALELDPDGNLCARDVSKNSRRSLSELSSATRMQLLLAVRIAWVEHLERETAGLPLFLDEALTTSDVHRFTEVARTVHQIVEESDRQVFYLSARLDDVSLWRHLSDSDVHHIDLAQIRAFSDQSTAGNSGRYIVETVEEMPAPDGRDPAEYAEVLGVPMIRPLQGAHSIHLFHVLRDDLDLLHDLLSTWRVVTVGQLDHLLRLPGGVQVIPEARRRSELEARCQSAIAWVDAWKVGRGKKVGRLDLEKAPAVSDAFLDRVAELAERVDGSAEALLVGLRDGEVHRFRSANIDQLREWLEEMGFLDSRPPLDLVGRRTAVLGSTADPDGRAQADLVIDWLEAASIP